MPRAEVTRRRREAGLCTACGTPSTDIRCQACRLKNRQKSHQRRDNHLCIYCGVRPPVPARVSCDPCRNRYRSWSQKNADLRNRLNRLSNDRLWKEILRAYGPVCRCCGESEEKFLTFDHVNNDGAAHRKQQGGNIMALRQLRKEGFPPGYQILCANCHIAKDMRGGCPHVKAQ